MHGPGGLIEGLGKEVKGRAFDARVVGRLLEFVKPHGLKLTVAFLMMVVASALALLTPYLMKVAIDEHIARADLDGLARVSLLLAAAFVAAYVAGSIQRYLLSWIGQRVLATIRGDLFRKIQLLSLSYHDRHKTGVTISRVINDVAVINDLLSQGMVTIVADLLVLGGIVVVMLGMSPRLALLAFAVLPLMVLATLVFSRHARVAFRETRAKIAAVVGDLAENLGGMRVIQAFGQEKRSHLDFDRVNRENMLAHVRAMSLSFVFMPVVEVLSTLATAVVLWFGGRAVAAEEVSLGVVVAFLSYVARFFQPIQELSQLYTTLQAAMAGGERVIEILDEPPAVADAADAQAMPPVQGRIELRDVCFSYTPGTPVLEQVSLVVEPGQTVALVGPTGAGKTSIASLVARFYDVDAGAVLIDGRDVRAVTQRSLRSQMAIVTQEPLLFSGTIRENITFANPSGGDEAMESAATSAEAQRFVSRLPKGYETRIQEGGVNLSVGQRQLIAIARAIYADPRILIMDEATSSVDTITEMVIQRALERLLRSRTAVVIAHRLSTIRNADRIFVVESGRIVESGRHEELLDAGGTYAALYRRLYLES
jgi:ABC-type multidrug transport system fused ATPase/permease subunit